MQSFFNFFSFIFLYVRYKKYKDPFKEFKNLPKDYYRIDKNSKILILAPFRVAPLSNLFEGLIGYFFKLRGYSVKAILCNQSVYYCENITYRDEKKRLAICALCLKEQKRFCDSFDIEPLNIDSFLSPYEHNEIESFINNLDVSKNDALVYKDINFEKIVKSAVTRYTLKSDLDLLKDSTITKGYFKTALMCSIASENIFKQFSPVSLIMSHGIYSTWGSILKSARRMDILTYVWARGYVGQGELMFGLNSSYLEDMILENKEVYLSFNYSLEDLDETQIYFKKKRNKESKIEYVNYYSTIKTKSYSLEDFILKNRIDTNKKIFGMFTNIPWDGQIFNQTAGFPNTNYYVNSVISWFEKNKDCYLIIRAHPAETDVEEGNGSEKFIDILCRLFPKLPDNVFFIPANSPISSYDLFDIIYSAIIYGSSIGLELAIAGIPVIQAGNFNTSSKGFVFEASNLNHLHYFLNLAKQGILQMSEEQIINATKFGNYWIYKRHIPDNTVILNRLIFESFKFKSINEFSKNSTLKFIFEKIESKEKIINYKV